MIGQLLSGSILFLIVLFAFFMYFEKKRMIKTDKYYSEKSYMAYGIGIGLALGAAIGISLDNIALGSGFGLAIGAAIGVALEKKYGKKIKLTPQIRKEKLKQLNLMFASLILGLAALVAFLLLNN